MSTQNTDRTTRSNRGIDHERLEDIPDVAATPNTNTTNQKTPSPTDTTASPESSVKRISMAEIQEMMELTVRKVTADLNARHQAEMLVQIDAVKDMEEKFKNLKSKQKRKQKRKQTCRPHRSKRHELHVHRISFIRKSSRQASRT
jgi:hypothetical protein